MSPKKSPLNFYKSMCYIVSDKSDMYLKIIKVYVYLGIIHTRKTPVAPNAYTRIGNLIFHSNHITN